jgi:fructose-bisphosphate aldolase class I
MTEELEAVATSLVAKGKGILAADETPGTLTRRFTALLRQAAGRSRSVHA